MARRGSPWRRRGYRGGGPKGGGGDMALNLVQAAFPDKMQGLFEPNRYKVMHGGRGSGKSWAAARALLITAAQAPDGLRVLCGREVQRSIKESVQALGVFKDRTELSGPDGAAAIQVLFVPPGGAAEAGPGPAAGRTEAEAGQAGAEAGQAGPGGDAADGGDLASGGQADGRLVALGAAGGSDAGVTMAMDSSLWLDATGGGAVEPTTEG